MSPKYDNPNSRGSIRTVITEFMKNEFARNGTTEFTSTEIFDGAREVAPEKRIDRTAIQNGINSMKAAGLIEKSGELRGTTGPSKYLWSLVEILEKATTPTPETTPEAEAEVEVLMDLSDGNSPDAGFTVQLGSTALTFSAATHPENPNEKEITMTNVTPSNDRKPRQGTPEHDIMQLTKLIARKDDQIDTLITEIEKLRDNQIKETDLAMKAGNESLAEILTGLKVTNAAIVSALEFTAREIALTRAGNEHVESQIEGVINSLKDTTEIINNWYTRGFGAGWDACERKLSDKVLGALKSRLGIAEDSEGRKDTLSGQAEKSATAHEDSLLGEIRKMFPSISVVDVTKL